MLASFLSQGYVVELLLTLEAAIDHVQYRGTILPFNPFPSVNNRPLWSLDWSAVESSRSPLPGQSLKVSNHLPTDGRLLLCPPSISF